MNRFPNTACVAVARERQTQAVIHSSRNLTAWSMTACLPRP